VKVNRSFGGICRLRLQARKVTKEGITRSRRRSERLGPEVTSARETNPTSYGMGWIDKHTCQSIRSFSCSKKRLNQSVWRKITNVLHVIPNISCSSADLFSVLSLALSGGNDFNQPERIVSVVANNEIDWQSPPLLEGNANIINLKNE
jgi:hypothetical protein